jgi:hypothetical protein
VTVDGDRLNVTVERQVAQFGDHTTVRAHLSVAVPQARPDEELIEYQDRIGMAVANLAFPLKEAVLNELGLAYVITDDGIILEAVQTEKQTTPAPKFNPAPPPARPTQNDATYPDIKVMEKGAGGGDKYGKVNPTSLSNAEDLVQAMQAAQAAGEDSVWTGVTKGRRWYRFGGNLWNKPAFEPEFDVDEPF